MTALLSIIAPVFALILTGFGIAKTPLWPAAATAHFNRFVFYVALPGLLFGKLGAGGVLDGVDPWLAAAYYGGCFAAMALAAALSLLLGPMPGDARALLAMAGGFSNTVLLGLPIIVLTFGDAAIGPVTAIIAFNSLLLTPLTSVMIETARSHRGRRRVLALVVAPLPGLVRNPILIAIVAGTAWGATGWGLALPVERFIGLLGDAAGPCALFALGASLAEYRLAGDPARTSLMVAVKLVAHPAIVWVLSTQVFALDALTAGVATLMAAIPVGATVFVLAQQYGSFVGPVTSSILISTGVSAGTLAVIIGLLT